MPPHTELNGEQSFYVGINLHNILYGIELYLFFKTMHIFLARRRARRTSDVHYVVFSIVMLILVTIWLAVDSTFGQEKWVMNESVLVPGGTRADMEIRAVEITACFIMQLMTDGLMIYRCRIVWNSLGAIIIPFILWLVTIALGVLVIWATSVPRTNVFSGDAAKFGVAYYSISIFLTATMTCMICYRLVRHAKTVKEYLGEEHATPYFSIVMLLVESVLPLTLTGIAYLVSYGIGFVAEVPLSQVYVTVMAVSPQMLILRVAQGNAWEKESMRPPLSALRFSEGRGNATGSGNLDTSEMEPQVESKAKHLAG